MDSESERALHCKCGSDKYRIKWEIDPLGDTWAECAECGRPSSTIGVGAEKLKRWMEQNE